MGKLRILGACLLVVGCSVNNGTPADVGIETSETDGKPSDTGTSTDATGVDPTCVLDSTFESYQFGFDAFVQQDDTDAVIESVNSSVIGLTLGDGGSTQFIADGLDLSAHFRAGESVSLGRLGSDETSESWLRSERTLAVAGTFQATCDTVDDGCASLQAVGLSNTVVKVSLEEGEWTQSCVSDVDSDCGLRQHGGIAREVRFDNGVDVTTALPNTPTQLNATTEVLNRSTSINSTPVGAQSTCTPFQTSIMRVLVIETLSD